MEFNHDIQTAPITHKKQAGVVIFSYLYSAYLIQKQHSLGSDSRFVVYCCVCECNRLGAKQTFSCICV